MTLDCRQREGETETEGTLHTFNFMAAYIQLQMTQTSQVSKAKNKVREQTSHFLVNIWHSCINEAKQARITKKTILKSKSFEQIFIQIMMQLWVTGIISMQDLEYCEGKKGSSIQCIYLGLQLDFHRDFIYYSWITVTINVKKQHITIPWHL